MKIIDLVVKPHGYKVGDECGDIVPNIRENSLFVDNGIPVGFFLSNIPDDMARVASYCNSELRSERVPKSLMSRSSAVTSRGEKKGVEQYSTIIGSIPPKPHMRRPYPSISSVHGVDSAHNFIKAMMLLCKQSEDLIQKIMPDQFEAQKKLIDENVKEKYRFGRLFTSSISNFNIAAAFHTDKQNIKGCVNVIIAKRENSYGGNTYVPDYEACMDSKDNSILVYPAWRNLHGVTPIKATKDGGYRNSLVFYPLMGFGK